MPEFAVYLQYSDEYKSAAIALSKMVQGNVQLSKFLKSTSSEMKKKYSSPNIQHYDLKARNFTLKFTRFLSHCYFCWLFLKMKKSFASLFPTLYFFVTFRLEGRQFHARFVSFDLLLFWLFVIIIMKGKFYFFVLQGSPKNFNFVLTLT
jgi:hypothetical protein